jgi:hypothetical protein
VDEIRKLTGCYVHLHDLEADWLTDAKVIAIFAGLT